MTSRRVARVAERIRQEASQTILYELRDPRIQFVTVTKVDLSNDLRHATIYVSVLGDDAKLRTTLRGLASARGLIQSRIAKALSLREAPIISFEFDPTIERSIEIAKLIDQARAESSERAQHTPVNEQGQEQPEEEQEEPPASDNEPPR